MGRNRRSCSTQPWYGSGTHAAIPGPAHIRRAQRTLDRSVRRQWSPGTRVSWSLALRFAPLMRLSRPSPWMVQPISSEYKLRAELDGPRRCHGAVPFAEGRAGDVRIEALVAETAGRASKDVLIPDIKELGTHFEPYFFGNLRPLKDSQSWLW